MSRFAGCTRWVYNQGLAWNEERRTADPAFHLSYAKLCTELLVWKEQNPWFRETHSQVLQQSLKDLMGGFQKFFKAGQYVHRSDSLRILSALWQRFRCR